MIDLVIHVGLPKTATTLIQKVMSGHPNYLGLESDRAIYTKQLFDIYGRYSRGLDVKNEIKTWGARVSDYKEDNNVNKPIVISSEFFFAGEFSGVSEFPLIEKVGDTERLIIADFLGLISHCLNGDFSVKMLLTIRNQPEWIASKYAQASAKIYGASQGDFENRLVRFSALKNSLWCDWGGVVKRFDKELGREKVNVLCIEEMDNGEFWKELSILFLGRDEEIDPRKNSTKELQAVNKKRKTSTEWSCQDFQFGAFVAKKYRVEPGTKMHRLLVRAGNSLSRVGLVVDSSREESIHLSKAARCSVEDCCAAGNLWLESRLGKRLRGLGYPVVPEFRNDSN